MPRAKPKRIRLSAKAIKIFYYYFYDTADANYVTKAKDLDNLIISKFRLNTIFFTYNVYT